MDIKGKLIIIGGAVDKGSLTKASFDKNVENNLNFFEKGILSRIEIIRTSPLICEPDKLKDPKSKDFRAFAIFNYRVTYQIKSSEKEIRIVRVRHTSREPLGY